MFDYNSEKCLVLMFSGVGQSHRSVLTMWTDVTILSKNHAQILIFHLYILCGTTACFFDHSAACMNDVSFVLGNQKNYCYS